MKRIGILGGMSYESTIKYYEVILQKYYELFHDFNYPEMVIFSLNFQKIIDYENNYLYTEYIKYLISGIEFLKNAGAEFIIMAANSPHSVFSELQNLIDIPILSIVNVTAKVAKSLNLNKLLLLGIKYTMQSSYYQNTFRTFGMNVNTPIIEEQEVIDDIIFKELVLGNINENNKNTLLHIIKNYDVDGVILGCTELPLILKQNDIDTIILDTLDIHTSEALKYCLE
ncbi:MAG: aspartate/glutamate racemase family protein [Candidatus Hermodarchaeota archaeon]